MNPVKHSASNIPTETASNSSRSPISHGMNVVIMAGGGGTRLWPLSLQDNPKQFVDVGTGKPLLQHAYERATQVTNPENIYVATAENYAKRVQNILKDVPVSRIFLEPTRRDTAAAFANVCLRLEKVGQGNIPTTFLWSDHVFTNEKKFIADLQAIGQVLTAKPQALILIGHIPLNPNTGLGYFRAREQVDQYENVYLIEEFIEKPDAEKAQEFVLSGNYFWNLGYFSFLPSMLIQKLANVTPELAPHMKQLSDAIQEDDTTAWKKAYSAFPKQALEKVFIEKLDEMYAITGDYGWSDVGNWSTVKELFGAEGDHEHSGHHVHVDSENNFIYNTTNKAVSIVGLNGAVVVVTDKAVLVCDEASAHKVKDVVKKIEAEGKDEYL